MQHQGKGGRRGGRGRGWGGRYGDDTSYGYSMSGGEGGFGYHGRNSMETHQYPDVARGVTFSPGGPFNQYHSGTGMGPFNG